MNWIIVFYLQQFAYLTSDRTIEISSILTTDIDFVCYLETKEKYTSLHIIQFSQDWEHTYLLNYIHTVFTPKHLDNGKTNSTKH